METSYPPIYDVSEDNEGEAKNASPQQKSPSPMTTITEVQWHFAIPVYSKIVSAFFERPEIRTGLLALMTQIENEAQASGQPGPSCCWQSQNNLHLMQHEAIQWLNREVGIMARDCVSSQTHQLPQFDIVMDACWANILAPGDWMPPHNHYPSQWSGVFYVSVNDALKQENQNKPDQKSGTIDFFSPVPLSSAYGLPNSVTYLPMDGLMLLYPGALQHMINPLVASEKAGARRYSIAFNLNVVPSAEG